MRYHLCTSFPHGKNLSECRGHSRALSGAPVTAYWGLPVRCAAPNRIQTAALSLSQHRATVVEQQGFDHHRPNEVSLCRTVQLTGVLLSVALQYNAVACLCQVLRKNVFLKCSAAESCSSAPASVISVTLSPPYRRASSLLRPSRSRGVTSV